MSLKCPFCKVDATSLEWEQPVGKQAGPPTLKRLATFDVSNAATPAASGYDIAGFLDAVSADGLDPALRAHACHLRLLSEPYTHVPRLFLREIQRKLCQRLCKRKGQSPSAVVRSAFTEAGLKLEMIHSFFSTAHMELFLATLAVAATGDPEKEATEPTTPGFDHNFEVYMRDVCNFTQVCTLLDKLRGDEDDDAAASLAPLARAAARGDGATLRTLFGGGADGRVDQRAIDTLDCMGHSALMHAAAEGSEGALEAILHGAAAAKLEVDANAVGHDGETALQLAVISGKATAVTAMVRFPGVDVNACRRQPKEGAAAVRGLSGDSLLPPLHLAAREGKLECVRALLRSSADVNLVHLPSVTPLMFACDGNRVEVAEALLEARADANWQRLANGGGSSLMYACANGNVETVQLLLRSPGLEVNATSGGSCSALMHACRGGHRAIVELLLTAAVGLEVNHVSDERETALRIAEELDDVEVTRMLRADPRIDREAGVSSAVRQCAAAAIKAVLLEVRRAAAAAAAAAAARAGEQQARACAATTLAARRAVAERYFTAVREGDADAVTQLLQSEASLDINARNERGETALMLAALADDAAVIDALRAADGTFVHVANAHEDAVLLSLEVDASTEDGHTAVDLAARAGCVTALRQLLTVRGGGGQWLPSLDGGDRRPQIARLESLGRAALLSLTEGDEATQTALRAALATLAEEDAALAADSEGDEGPDEGGINPEE